MRLSTILLITTLQFIVICQTLAIKFEKRANVFKNLKLKLPGSSNNKNSSPSTSPKSIFGNSIFSGSSHSSANSSPRVSPPGSPSSGSSHGNRGTINRAPTISPARSPSGNSSPSSPKTSPNRPEWYERERHSPDIENFHRAQDLASKAERQAQGIAKNTQNMHKISQKLAAKGRDTTQKGIENSFMRKIPGSLERSYLKNQNSFNKHQNELNNYNQQIDYHYSSGSLNSKFLNQQHLRNDMNNAINKPIKDAQIRMIDNKVKYNKGINFRF